MLASGTVGEQAGAPPGAMRAAATLRDLARHRRAPAVVAFAVYLAFALGITWPWITDPGHILYGVQGSDLTASVAQYQQLANAHQAPFVPGTLPNLNAPEGLSTTWALYLAGFGSSTALWLLSMAVGSVAAHGLMAVAGFSLSAFSMFLLARRITGHSGASFVAGLAFGFWPFQYGTAWTWPHYTQLWVFVLLLWRMQVLSERPTLRNGVLAGLATVFAMTWIQYHLLIAGVLFATLMVLGLIRGWRAGTFRSQLLAHAVASVLVLVVALGVALAGAADQFQGVPSRGADEAVQQSARPLMYLLPGPNHPIFGSSIGHWLADKYANPALNPSSTASYAAIYLGIPMLLLALFGVVLTAQRLHHRRAAPRTPDWTARAGVTAVVVGVVGLLFSAPPQVQRFGLTIPMPYKVISDVTPVFRVAHRFAIFVMLAVCVLAAIGVRRLTAHGGRVAQTLLVVAIAVVVAIDLWGRPNPSWTRTSHPHIYDVVKRQPPGILAVYPLDDTEYGDELGSLFQNVYHHPMFNGFDPGSVSGSKKLELTYLLDKRTVPDLAAYGVKYVLERNGGGNLPAWLPKPGQRVRGLARIYADDYGTLYRVVAKPAQTTSYALTGFNAPEGNPPHVVRWQAANGGEIELQSNCSPCEGTVSFLSGTFAQPRRLTIRDQHGTVLYDAEVASSRHVTFKVHFSHRLLLRFSTDPPPVRINSVLGGPDTRSFGIYVGQPLRFVPRSVR